MKRILTLIAVLSLLFALAGCSPPEPQETIAATTLPVYEFTSRLCSGTDISVTRLVTENVSCLHDYALSVRQVKAVESAELVIVNGAGLEAFMDNLLINSTSIDSSEDVPLLECHEEHDHDHGHGHESDPHFWLSPTHAKVMVQNICAGLKSEYPQRSTAFDRNLTALLSDLDKLQIYGQQQLNELTCRKLITFHDGFSYFAEAFDLTILEAVEEESGSEASAAELKHLITLVESHNLPAIFTEKSGSVSAAHVISAETNAKIFTLDMAMSGNSYFEAMYYNINTVREALG